MENKVFNYNGTDITFASDENGLMVNATMPKIFPIIKSLFQNPLSKHYYGNRIYTR